MQLIKKIATDAILNNKPVEFMTGIVESIEPIKIRVNQFLLLESNMLIIPHYMSIGNKYFFNLDEQKVILEDVETEEKKEYKMTVEKQELVLDFNINENDKILLLGLFLIFVPISVDISAFSPYTTTPESVMDSVITLLSCTIFTLYPSERSTLPV